MFDFTAFATNLLSCINTFMTVPTYSIYGISFPESKSASRMHIYAINCSLLCEKESQANSTLHSITHI